MQVWPAIDLSDGYVVRLRQGRWQEKVAYTADVVQVARRFEAEGANGLHVVDLDAAYLGEPRNRRLIGRILEAVNIPVQVGGGLRTWEDIEEVRRLGAQRVVIGTRAATDEDFLREVAQELGESLVVAVDARGGKVAIRGWREVTPWEAPLFAQHLKELGVRRLLLTDIAVDGTLEGPNLASLKQVAQAAGLPILASGGISRLEHVEALLALEPLGVEGFVVGRALYEETLRLRELVQFLHKRLSSRREEA